MTQYKVLIIQSVTTFIVLPCLIYSSVRYCNALCISSHCTVPYCFTVMYSTVQIFQHTVLYCNVYDVLYCTVFQGHSAVLDRLPAHVRQGINKRSIARRYGNIRYS